MESQITVQLQYSSIQSNFSSCPLSLCHDLHSRPRIARGVGILPLFGSFGNSEICRCVITCATSHSSCAGVASSCHWFFRKWKSASGRRDRILTKFGYFRFCSTTLRSQCEKALNRGCEASYIQTKTTINNRVHVKHTDPHPSTKYRTDFERFRCVYMRSQRMSGCAEHRLQY